MYQNDKNENTLLKMTNNISQYIRYYDKNTFKEDIDDIYGKSWEKEYYTYSIISDYVFKNSIIVNQKYNRDVFLKFFFSNEINLPESSPYDIEQIKQDIEVTKREINYLYFFKNWEIDKNLYLIEDDVLESTDFKNDYLTNIKLTNAMKHIATCFKPLNSSYYDKLVFFKEKNDCELICMSYIKTPEDDCAKVVLLFTTKDQSNENDYEIPYMFLDVSIDIPDDDNVNITSILDNTFESKSDEYDEFMDIFYTSTLHCMILARMMNRELTKINISQDENNMSTYKKPNIKFIKNKYREIFIGRYKIEI